MSRALKLTLAGLSFFVAVLVFGSHYGAGTRALHAQPAHQNFYPEGGSDGPP